VCSSDLAWRNSPLLVDKFFSEWTLGVFIAVQHGDLILVHDTEGNVLDMESVGLEPAPRRMLERAFPAAAGSRLTRMSFGSLDMSEQAIRTLAVRTRAFETTFTDLLDPHLVPTAPLVSSKAVDVTSASQTRASENPASGAFRLPTIWSGRTQWRGN